MKRLFACLLVSAVLSACQDADQKTLLDPPAAGVVPDRAGPGDLTVVSWNVYYGADLDVLLIDDGTPLPVLVAQVFGQVQATDAPARAAAIAKQLAASPPHLIGLQEVVRLRMQSPGDFLDEFGNINNPFPNAEAEVFDFLTLLRNALLAEGLVYAEAARTTTLDVELPMYTGSPCPPCADLRFTESVAILARSDFAFSNAQGNIYAVNLPVSVAGLTLDILKGWASVDVAVKGQPYRFVTTHLEPADRGPGHAIVPELHQIQLAQAAELLSTLAGAQMPVIVTGDLNTEPGGSSTDTYGMMAAAGFVDTWLVGGHRGNGFTANQDADLLNTPSKLWHRIDFVLYRDGKTADGGPFRGAVHAAVLGDQQADRTPSGLWPSDHAGVHAVLKPAQARFR